MSEVRLSQLGVADVPAVLELLKGSELPEIGVQENPGAFVVARKGHDIIGCCGVELHGTDGLLRSLVVAASHRGDGIATALVEHVLSLPEYSHLGSIYLLTTTARGFFPRFSFEVCPRDQAPAAIRASWEFRTGCPDSAVFMRRTGR
jgi:amino-acid N-acetyltransferase